MESFVQSPLAWGITTALAVISVLLAIIIKKRRVLEYDIKSFELIHEGMDLVEGLSHLFKGELINNLTISTIYLWNNGNVSLRRADIVPAKPIRISIHDGRSILEKSIIYQREDSNRFSICNLDKSQFYLDFDCVGKQEGIIMQIYHTGDKTDLKIDGKIIDGKIKVCSYAWRGIVDTFLNCLSVASYTGIAYVMLRVLLLLLYPSDVTNHVSTISIIIACLSLLYLVFFQLYDRKSRWAYNRSKLQFEYERAKSNKK